MVLPPNRPAPNPRAGNLPPEPPVHGQPPGAGPPEDGGTPEEGMEQLIELIMTHPDMAPVREAVFAKMQQMEGGEPGAMPPDMPPGPPPGMPPQAPPGPPGGDPGRDQATPFLDHQRRQRQQGRRG